MSLTLVQGTPRVIGEKTIIPVALVAFFQGSPRFELFWARPLAFREIGPRNERLIPLFPLPGAERRFQMEPGGILKDIVDNLRSSASVNAVFGETRETQGKAIIPVACVHYCFGAGGGEGAGPAAGEGQPPVAGSGGGGGGMVKARPLAVLEVTPEETRVLPVVDFSRLASMAIGGFFALWLLRTLRRRHK